MNVVCLAENVIVKTGAFRFSAKTIVKGKTTLKGNLMQG